MNYIGIDPGKSGGVACVPDLRTWRTPVDAEREYDLPGMKRVLVDAIGDGEAFITIERAQAMRKPAKGEVPCNLCGKAPSTQGVASSFEFGKGYGIWIGLIVGLGCTFIDVPPQSWTKMMVKGAPGEGKDRSIWVAKRRFPEWQPRFRSEELAFCDAINLAEYGRVTQTREVFSKPNELEFEYA